MNSDRTPTLDDLVALRVPEVRRRTLLAAFDRARPASFSPYVTGSTRLDAESVAKLRETFETFPGALRLPEVRRTLGIRKGTTGDAFEKALHERLLRIVDDAVTIATTLQREAREHPPLDLADLPGAPVHDDGYPVAAARYVAAHGEAYGILNVASYAPSTGMLMTQEVWKYPGGGRGGEWRSQHIEDFVGDGWVRDPDPARLS